MLDVCNVRARVSIISLTSSRQNLTRASRSNIGTRPELEEEFAIAISTFLVKIPSELQKSKSAEFLLVDSIRVRQRRHFRYFETCIEKKE